MLRKVMMNRSGHSGSRRHMALQLPAIYLFLLSGAGT
jgi:hypothetical protein